jgi:4-hydroxy-tetrahydrodipicolinate synthase
MGKQAGRVHRGLFAIPVTPFDEQGAIDEASLHRVMQFMVEAGAHGVVTPVNVSEFTTLTEEERQLVTRVAVQECGQHVPVVIGVCARTTAEAVRLSRYAEEAGADAVIAMPPYEPHPETEEGIVAFYAALAEAVSIPIYIQNHERPIGTPMSAELVARLLREIDDVQYVKEESVGSGQKLSATLKLAGDACKGIMGGKAGRYLLDEFRRGACGTMPACEIADCHAQLWNALDAGQERRARDIFNQMLPLLNYEAAFSVAVYKDIMWRRGIIATPTRRLPGLVLDAADHVELDAILADLEPLFTIKTAIKRRR